MVEYGLGSRNEDVEKWPGGEKYSDGGGGRTYCWVGHKA